MTPTNVLFHQYKNKPFEEKIELVNELTARSLAKMRGAKLPYGMFVPSLRRVIFLAVRLEVMPVMQRPAQCAAEYVNV